jgi:Na+/H+ antiporter NhaD/arsenite permease-like protein
MYEGATSNGMSTPAVVRRAGLLLLLATAAGLAGQLIGFTTTQSVALSVFLSTILGTLLFWNLRLSIAFLGVSVLILTKSLDLPTLVEATSLPVILFLAGMMVIVGALRDTGFFTWVVQSIVAMPRITGRKFIAVTAIASALLACLVDEVTSIIFISALVFQVCERLKLNPAPYLMTCVLCTNVGSAGTMMGNPVGIYIGTQAGLTFFDFILWSFPVMLLALVATLGVTMLWFRRELDVFDERLAERLSRNLSLAPDIQVPHRQGVILLTITFLIIASHHQVEQLLGLATNSALLIAPLACAGGVMIWRHKRARFYIEREVDWWTLLFFMLLFAVAGTLEHVGLTQKMAEGFTSAFGSNPKSLIPIIIGTTGIGSAFVDNVVFVAAFSPVVSALSDTMFGMPLWWAMLFGACFGGNITMIGSTANIVALGLLEKHGHIHISFWEWLKVGFVSAIVAGAVAWGALLVASPAMERYATARHWSTPTSPASPAPVLPSP